MLTLGMVLVYAGVIIGLRPRSKPWHNSAPRRWVAAAEVRLSSSALRLYNVSCL